MSGKGFRGHGWIFWGVVILVGIFVYQNPEQAAGLIHQGIDLLESAADSAVTFVSSVAAGM